MPAVVERREVLKRVAVRVENAQDAEQGVVALGLVVADGDLISCENNQR